MNEVQPIRDKKKLMAIQAYLKEKDIKYYLMFKIGINTGLRVSDVLTLKVSDTKDMYKGIREKKTKKTRSLYLETSEELLRELKCYIESNELIDSDYLFPSRKHDAEGNRQPIGRVQAYRIIQEAGEACGVSDVGTHTMRKTFGYFYYKKTKDIATLQLIFNHSSQKVTLRYIGIEREQIAESLKDFYL